MKYYLAYGSNLNKRQMAIRCPDALPIGSCVLNDYELVFRGVATIEPKKGASVQCGVWKISFQDEKNLDLYEGFPNLYVKKFLNVTVNGEEIKAMAYIMVKGIKPIRQPSTRYLLTIMEGYEDFGLNITPLTEAVIRGACE